MLLACVRFRLAVPCVVAAVLACAAFAGEIEALRLIGTTTLPPGLRVEQMPVGGLSGLDYDKAHDRWIAIADDRSELGPARAYRLRIDYDANAVGEVGVEAATILRQPDGTVYPSRQTVGEKGGVVVDLEAIRFDPRNGSLWYTSEGEKKLGMDPFVRQASPDGAYLGQLPVPASFHWSQTPEKGPRVNFTLESLSFSPDGNSLWTSFEGPLIEDGPLPTPEAGAWTRFTQFSREGEVLAQYAYRLEAISEAPGPGLYADNGVSELLATGERSFLVLERSGVQPTKDSFHVYVRLYAACAETATDVKEVGSLERSPDFKPLAKRILVDFNQLDAGKVDNLECLSWGRKLPNGHDTLLVMSDDNFNATQVTQVWVFEVMPGSAPAAAAK